MVDSKWLFLACTVVLVILLVLFMLFWDRFIPNTQTPFTPYTSQFVPSSFSSNDPPPQRKLTKQGSVELREHLMPVVDYKGMD